VERIHSGRDGRNRTFSEQGRDFSRLVVSPEKNRLRGQAQRLSGDLRRLGGGCGGGGGGPFRFQQGGEGNEGSGGNGLGFHAVF